MPVPAGVPWALQCIVQERGRNEPQVQQNQQIKGSCSGLRLGVYVRANSCWRQAEPWDLHTLVDWGLNSPLTKPRTEGRKKAMFTSLQQSGVITLYLCYLADQFKVRPIARAAIRKLSSCFKEHLNTLACWTKWSMLRHWTTGSNSVRKKQTMHSAPHIHKNLLYLPQTNRVLN